jgi:2-polyprenyl-3-methyl-5-hydroxy-6-metoxy-1,4-benzoquinol methylase
MDYYNIPTKIDNDPLIGYEKNSWVDTLKLPLILGLAFWVALKKIILGPNLKINTFWFDGISPTCREMKENAMHWKALDIAYNYKFEKGNDFITKITDFWLKIKNAKAVRNRLKLVKKKLRKEINSVLGKEPEIRLLSIACGSAQGVIEVMAEFKQKGASIKAIFLDLDPSAIEYSKKMAQKAGVINQITFVNRSAGDLEVAVNEFKPHIVEMVGFLEYRPKEKAIILTEKINKLLTSGGVALISNIAPNFERGFLSQVLNWPMVYRSPKELSEVIIKGGFNPKNCEIVYEPLRIHGIAICRKTI